MQGERGAEVACEERGEGCGGGEPRLYVLDEGDEGFVFLGGRVPWGAVSDQFESCGFFSVYKDLRFFGSVTQARGL